MRDEPPNRALSPLEPAPSHAMERYAVYQTPSEAPEGQEFAVPLSNYVWILRRHAVVLVAFVALAAGATYVVSSRITPIYESTATLDVDRAIPSSVIGQDSNGVRGTANDTDTFLSTQVEII